MLIVRIALRSSSGSVRCIKHDYPDHHDKSERQKRGQRHELLPAVGLWTRSLVPFFVLFVAPTGFQQVQQLRQSHPS